VDAIIGLRPGVPEDGFLCARLTLGDGWAPSLSPPQLRKRESCTMLRRFYLCGPAKSEVTKCDHANVLEALEGDH
jgi:hypothetical protein